MADVAVQVTAQDPFHSTKPILNGHHVPEQLKNVELLAEKKKRKAAEKEASRWHRKAAELQAQVDELEQQKQQASAQASAAPIAVCNEAQGRESDEQYVAHLVALMLTRVKARQEAMAQVAEEVAAARLARERAAREARMEEAIARARMRLEHEESASWSRRLEQAALAAGFVGLGALGAYLTIRLVQSSGSAPSAHNWRTGTDTASLTRAAVAASSAPMGAVIAAVPGQEAYQLSSLISTADILEQRASMPPGACVAPAAPAAAAAAVTDAGQGSGARTQAGVVHAAADRLVQHVGRSVDSMAAGAPFGVVAASSAREAPSAVGSFLRIVCSLAESCW